MTHFQSPFLESSQFFFFLGCCLFKEHMPGLSELESPALNIFNISSRLTRQTGQVFSAFKIIYLGSVDSRLLPFFTFCFFGHFFTLTLKGITFSLICDLAALLCH